MKKREMTDEIRKQLSGLLPLAPRSVLPHTPDAFQRVEEAFRPVFYLRQFPLPVRKEIDARITAGTLDREVMVRALAEGEPEARACGGWENLLDLVDGVAYPYSHERIGHLPDNLVGWLFWKCMEFSGMTAIEREGLGSSPQSMSEPSSKTAAPVDVPQT
jgi:hypothetical protein